LNIILLFTPKVKVKGKGKVVPALKYAALKTYPLINYAPRHEDVLWKWKKLHSFLTPAIGGGEWSASRPDRFILG